jgi:hypothetical protein
VNEEALREEEEKKLNFVFLLWENFLQFLWENIKV